MRLDGETGSAWKELSAFKDDTRRPASDSLLPILRKPGEGVRTPLMEALRLPGVAVFGVTVVELVGEPLILHVIVSLKTLEGLNQTHLSPALSPSTCDVFGDRKPPAALARLRVEGGVLYVAC